MHLTPISVRNACVSH